MDNDICKVAGFQSLYQTLLLKIVKKLLLFIVFIDLFCMCTKGFPLGHGDES